MKKLYKIVAIVLMVFTLGFCITTVAVSSQNVAVVEAATVLKQGSKGADVKTLQRKLKNWGYYTGSVDGIFGKQTTAAVKYFQRRNGLVADGIVGKKTLSALGMKLSGSSSSNNATGQYNDNDLYLLAKLIHAEARGESYTGQVAVGAVVLNRVKNASFPNSISGVIYQKYAFTCVADGQINLEPNQTAMKAAKDAMNGWDPSYSALYYYNPKTATSSWIFSRKTTVVIGRHVFAI